MSACGSSALGDSSRQAAALSALHGLWFLEAASTNDLQQLQEMLSEGLVNPTIADLSGRTAAHAAAAAGAEAALAFLLQRGAPADAATKRGGGRPLHLAAARGHVACVDLLLRACANASVADSSGKTPLHEAAWQGHVGCVERLLAAGVPLEVGDAWGRTPLHWAVMPPEWVASADCMAVVAVLFANKAAVEAATKGHCTPLHLAAAFGRPGAMRQLLEASADCVARDDAGETPLHKAAAREDATAAKLLLQGGADAHARDGLGRTPRQRALEERRAEVASLLP